MKILIAGDSFASAELAGEYGWVQQLADVHPVTNISSPGIGEYKIYQRLNSVELDWYDAIIVSHTSPNRVHCEENFLYPNGHIYRASDLIFADVESKRKTNKFAESMFEYFGFVFDPDYYKFVHSSSCQAIDQLTQNKKVIHITHFDWTDLYTFSSMINFYQTWVSNQGTCNHYNKQGNEIIFQTVMKELNV
jgi:hypothetical protein